MIEWQLLRPEWFLAVPLAAFWLGLWWWQGRADGGWGRYVDKHLLDAMLGRSAQRSTVAFWSVIALAAMWVLAMVGPSFTRTEVPADRGGQVRLFLLDMSRSMYATDIAPSRIDQARLKLIDALNVSSDRPVALIGFAAYPYTLTPVTDDINTLKLIAPLIEPNMAPAQGADIDAALRHARAVAEQANARGGDIVVLTDSLPTDAALDTARTLAREGLRVSVLALGTEVPVDVPRGDDVLRYTNGEKVQARPAQAALRALADAGEGQFVAVTHGAVSVEPVLAAAVSGRARGSAVENRVVLWRDDGVWLLWLALVPVCLLARKGALL